MTFELATRTLVNSGREAGSIKPSVLTCPASLLFKGRKEITNMKTGYRQAPSLSQKLWAAVCRWAYRKAYKRGAIPTGLPGNRDPESPCEQYFPVVHPSGSGPCRSDGHYLCSGCEWIEQERLDEI